MGFREKIAEAREEAIRQKMVDKERRAAGITPIRHESASFEGIKMQGGRISRGGTGGPVAGATARVETGADAGKRITATRLVATGVFALAIKKKTGHVFLTIEHPDYDIVVEVPTKKESDARKFASKVNNAARS